MTRRIDFMIKAGEAMRCSMFWSFIGSTRGKLHDVFRCLLDLHFSSYLFVLVERNGPVLLRSCDVVAYGVYLTTMFMAQVASHKRCPHSKIHSCDDCVGARLPNPETLDAAAVEALMRLCETLTMYAHAMGFQIVSSGSITYRTVNATTLLRCYYGFKQ
jgi:hypothetical protein